MEDKASRVWKRFQEVMHYTDEEMAIFKANPRFVKMMNTPAFRTHRIVFEVISSHGCVCQHSVGQRIVLNGNGALIRDDCPPVMCLGILSQLYAPVQAIWERMVAGIDPNGVLIDTIGCVDVDVRCGGWGKVITRVHVEGPK